MMVMFVKSTPRIASDTANRRARHTEDPSEDLPIGSTELAERLLAEQSALIVPGDQFGIDDYFRIGYGYTSPPLAPGLERLSWMIERLAAARAG